MYPMFLSYFLATSRWDICVLFTTPKRNPTQIQVRLSRLHKRFYKVDLTELLDKFTSLHITVSMTATILKLDKKNQIQLKFLRAEPNIARKNFHFSNFSWVGS